MAVWIEKRWKSVDDLLSALMWSIDSIGIKHVLD